MYDDEELSEIREAHAEWEAETLDPTLDRHGERRDRFATVSNHEVDRLYTPPTWPTSTTRRISDSRARSRTRGGVYPTMHRGRTWTMRQFAGFGTAEETNERFHYLTDEGGRPGSRPPSTCPR